MNKILPVLIPVLLCFTNSRGQNPTPNPGFENWTQVGNHWDPDSWNTLNPSTSVVGILTATRGMGADVHSGNLSIKLTTKIVFSLTANGIASTGTIITTPPYGVTGGIPFTGRPDSIAGWYKCSPQPGDTGFAQLLLLDATGDSVGFVRWWAPAVPVTAFTRFSAAIDYYSAANPTLAQWILSSSKGFNQVENSMIIFDDIEIITNPVGLPDRPEAESIRVFPSAGNGSVTISNQSGKKLNFNLYNSLGEPVYQGSLTETQNFLRFEHTGPGLYLYRITDQGGAFISHGKLLFQ